MLWIPIWKVLRSPAAAATNAFNLCKSSLNSIWVKVFNPWCCSIDFCLPFFLLAFYAQFTSCIARLCRAAMRKQSQIFSWHWPSNCFQTDPRHNSFPINIPTFLLESTPHFLSEFFASVFCVSLSLSHTHTHTQTNMFKEVIFCIW